MKWISIKITHILAAHRLVNRISSIAASEELMWHSCPLHINCPYPPHPPRRTSIFTSSNFIRSYSNIFLIPVLSWKAEWTIIPVIESVATWTLLFNQDSGGCIWPSGWHGVTLCAASSCRKISDNIQCASENCSNMWLRLIAKEFFFFRSTLGWNSKTNISETETCCVWNESQRVESDRSGLHTMDEGLFRDCLLLP